MAEKVQSACPSFRLDAAQERGYISGLQRAGIAEVNSLIDGNPGTARYRSVNFYHQQSKQILGDGDDRVKVPIWVHSSVDRLWHQHIKWAIGEINLAAPGLNLYKIESAGKYKVKIVGTGEMVANTKGSILAKEGHAGNNNTWP